MTAAAGAKIQSPAVNSVVATIGEDLGKCLDGISVS